MNQINLLRSKTWSLTYLFNYLHLHKSIKIRRLKRILVKYHVPIEMVQDMEEIKV